MCAVLVLLCYDWCLLLCGDWVGILFGDYVCFVYVVVELLSIRCYVAVYWALSVWLTRYQPNKIPGFSRTFIIFSGPCSRLF